LLPDFGHWLTETQGVNSRIARQSIGPSEAVMFISKVGPERGQPIFIPYLTL
jgi:hypothetical protein